VITQTLMAGPLIALYNLSVLLAFLFSRRSKSRDRQANAAG
jgi:Sec-independent protein secretion pathway component TatC